MSKYTEEKFEVMFKGRKRVVVFDLIEDKTVFDETCVTSAFRPGELFACIRIQEPEKSVA